MRITLVPAVIAVALPALASAQPSQTPVLYPLVGVYSAGTQIRLQHSELPRLAQSQFGLGLLSPLGAGAIGLEVVTSAVKGTWQWDGRRGPAENDNFASVRRVAVVVHAGRRWRSERLAIYVGGGLSLERQHEQHRFRDLIGRDDNRQPVLSDVWTEERYAIGYLTPLLRVSTDVSLTSRFALRSAYTFAIRYMDMPKVHAFDVGVGFRFGSAAQ